MEILHIRNWINFRDKYLIRFPKPVENHDGSLVQENLENAKILDIGSKRVKRNHNTYRRLFPPPFSYLGMDIEPGLNVDIVGYENIPNFPFDIVISGQVMEHIKYPWEWLKKLKKYFKYYICIIAPNTCVEHGYPFDTFRYFPDGMRALFEWAGIKEVEILKSGADTIGIGTICNEKEY